MYEKTELKNKAAIIDVNHSNSGKRYKEQIRIVGEVLHSRKCSETLINLVMGFMIESYIEEGSQPVNGEVYGKSITDPCIGWDDTEKLIGMIADKC